MSLRQKWERENNMSDLANELVCEITSWIADIDKETNLSKDSIFLMKMGVLFGIKQSLYGVDKYSLEELHKVYHILSKLYDPDKKENI